MPLPTNDVSSLTPPKMPDPAEEANTGGLPGLPPTPPGAAPAAGASPAPSAATGMPPTPPGAAPAGNASEQAASPDKQTERSGSPPPLAEVSRVPATQEDAPAGGSLTAQTGPKAMMQAFSEMGFDGVDLTTFGVFPIVSLQKETFKSTEGDVLGHSFKGHPVSSRKKYIYKNGLANEDPRNTFFYTYDDELAINGESVADKLAEWRSQGWTPIKKPYVELFIRLAEGEKAGQVVALSIPQTSISRFSNFMVRLMARGQENMQETLCEFGQGKEITGPKIKNPWIPLDFKILQ